jgi:hypothetical protein
MGMVSLAKWWSLRTVASVIMDISISADKCVPILTQNRGWLAARCQDIRLAFFQTASGIYTFLGHYSHFIRKPDFEPTLPRDEM